MNYLYNLRFIMKYQQQSYRSITIDIIGGLVSIAIPGESENIFITGRAYNPLRFYDPDSITKKPEPSD